MALVLADRVRETSSTTGTGTITLDGAVIGYQSFGAAIGAGNTCYYTISNPGTSEWEVGIGTVGSGTLARTSILSSSTGSAVSFTSGNKDVFVTYPAEKSVYLDASGNASPLGSASATQLDITAQGDLRLQDTTGGEYVALQAPGTLATSYTLTLPVDDGTAGQALVTDGSGVLSWSSAASGDVYGPASATDNAVARYDGTTGKIIQNSAVTIADTTGDMTGVGTLTLSSTLGVKTAASAEYNILVGGNLTGGVNSGGLRFQSQVQSDVTSNARGIISIPSTAAAAFTISNLEHFFAGQGSLGAGSAVTSQYGYRAASSLTGATNNYGFYGDIPSGTNRWNFYAAGTADNYFAGNVAIGTTTTSVAPLYVVGNMATNQAVLSRVSSALAVGSRGFRQIIDGVEFFALYHTNSNTVLTSTGAISLGAAPGAESLRVTPVASAVNYWDMIGAASGNIGVYARGSDTNIGMNFVGKGTGQTFFNNNGANQFAIGSTASAVNYLEATGNITGNGPSLTAQGSDVNVALLLRSKGSGYLYFIGSNTNQFVVAPTASAVNYLQVTGGATGGEPILSAQGSDANINLRYYTKGINSHIFATNGGAQTQFVVAHTASAVNYLQINGSAAGTRTSITSAGSDASVGINYLAKGSEGHAFFSHSGSAIQLFVSSTASAVNYAQVTGGATGVWPILSAQGADANVGLVFKGKGTSGHLFQNGAGANQFVIATTPSAVNYVQAAGNATGGYPNLLSNGTDTNVGFDLATKGNAPFRFYTDSFGSQQFRITHIASAVNYLQVTGNSTGLYPSITATGSDATVGLVINTKGGASQQFYTGNQLQFNIAHTASAVNYIQVTGQPTTFGPLISSQGSDTNINMVYASKGAGSHSFGTGGGGFILQFMVGHVASAVNYLQALGSTTGNAPSFAAAGSDTNIDITLTPKGTGVVRDANGNIRAVPKSGATKTGSYTLATTDIGEFIEVGTGGSITIPDATFATGDIVSVFNNTSGNITITCTITTAYIGGTDADKATVTLATRGVATILFISGTVCVINGNVS